MINTDNKSDILLFNIFIYNDYNEEKGIPFIVVMIINTDNNKWIIILGDDIVSILIAMKK